MKKVIYFLSITLFLVTGFNKTFAQTATTSIDTIGDDKKSEKKASFKIGVNYSSNSVFMGRADTVTTPIIEPVIKYTFKSGIYVSGNIDYMPNRTKGRLDAANLTAGYDYDITDDLDGGVSFTKLFYNKNSSQIGSSISSTLSADLNYDIAGIVTPSVSVDYNFVKQGFGNDIFVNFGLAHDFVIEGVFSDDDKFFISPTASVNTGTQNFYDAYLTTKKYKLTAKGQAKQAAQKKLLAAQDAKLAKFTLLDAEFSAPLEYKTGHLILSFIPTYAIAENKLPAAITKSMVNSKGLFYFETGAALKF